ncbi:MAG: glycosyltransferase family A protein [Patescibacteria group bacterium]|nr:glycosyltransferase family A protein [Patescibacteria group bacterium]MDD4819164.1 glycosyltransferase family A protein [Candidatus Colwellbacteria bacterium]
MISIIIPVYNGAKTLVATISSIEKQTWRDFEVIIVNDGSCDETVSVFENFSKSNELINNYHFINQENKGAPSARNRGLEEASGDFLFFCDADAVLKEDALEKMMQTLEANPSASYVYSSFYWGSKLFKLWPFDPERLKKMPYIHTMALIRREDFPSCGWDESIKKLQDWDLWLTMLEQGHSGVFIDEILFKVKPGGKISSWLPAFAYKTFSFLPKVKKYKQALKIVKEKHNLL